MAIYLDGDTLAAIVDADRDSMSDDDLTMEERAHCAHSLRLGETLQQERAAHARTRAELAAARASSPPSPGLVEAARDFVDVADRAEAARTMRTGMQAPYHGDFANMAPSTARALRKWADRFRAALPKEPTP